MVHPKHIRFTILLVVLALFVPLGLFAQSTTGSITGNVTDASGAAMPGVTVTATSVSTSTSRSTVSNPAGYYEIPLLIPGTYRVAAVLSGFQPLKFNDIVVNIGTAVTLNMKMKVGVAEIVTVTAAAPVIETTKSEVSSVVNDRAIQNLPTNGRNFINFVLTTPGVVTDVRLGDISFAGQRGTLNSLVVDGSNDDNTFFGQTVGRTGSGRAPYQFSEDAVKEFQVNTNSYSAEYGRAGGAVINVVTKSGTNDFLGNAFDYYRDKSLNANNYINQINNRPKSPYHYDQYGVSVGGPIVRDKHFFFANVDLQRNSTPNPVVLGSGHVVFPTDPASQAALQTLTPLAAEYSQKQNQNGFLLKTDSQFTASQHLSLRYNNQRFTGVNFENFGITNSAQHSGNSNVVTDSYAANYDMTASNSFFNEVRAQYLKDSEPGQANSSDPEAQIFQSGNPVIFIGRNSFSPRETTITRYQIADTATYVLQNHTFKAGFDYNHDNILNWFPGNFSGSYRFNSLADFANKTPASFTQAFPGPGTTGPFTHPNLRELGLFVQDEWHTLPSLTVNAGLRYDREAVAQATVLNPDPQLQAAGYFTNKIPSGNGDIGPRLGFAWTPGTSNRTVVRGGYGIFYGTTPSIMYGTAMSNNGINVQTITFTGNLIPQYPSIYSSLPSGATLPKPTIFVFDPHFKQPRVQQGNLGAEQQIGDNYSIGVTYQWVQGNNLQRSRDVNVSTPVPTTLTIAGGGTVVLNRYTGRPFSNFNRVIAFESSAHSRYNGVTVNVQKRFANNWQGSVSWTHGTVKDDKPDATAVVPFSSGDDSKYVSDPLNIGHDWAYGANDVRDRVVLSGVWSLDSYANNLTGIAHALVSGWTISGIVSYQTGQPFTPNVNSDLLNDGNPSNDIAPGFTRNSMRLPSQFEIDPRITRDIPIFGATRLQLIVEAYNLLNRQNVNGVNTVYYSYNATTKTLAPLSTFGVPTSTAGQRIVQLAAKVVF